MKLKTKSLLFITVSTVTLTLLVTVGIHFVIRAYSLTDTREQGAMAAEIVRVALTEEMLNGVISARSGLLGRIQHVPGLVEVHLVRGQPVIDQFGPGTHSEQQVSDLESRVLSTGKVMEELTEGDRVLFHYTVPFTATSGGGVNCLRCHEVPEGTVNGAITLTMDLTENRLTSQKLVAGVALILIVFLAIMIFALRRLLHPIVGMAGKFKQVMSMAGGGDFSGRIHLKRSDELGEIASATDDLMQTLEESFGGMAQDIEGLTDHITMPGEGSLMARTKQMIRNMVDATRFKQAIENDRDLDEVFLRFRRVMVEKFDLDRVSLYEVIDGKSLRLVFAVGVPEGHEIWCAPEILLKSEACRACRAGSIVSSINDPAICSCYRGNDIQTDSQLQHVCIPIIMAGHIGAVLQILLDGGTEEEIYGKVAAIRTYIQEATPVIEAKRLTQSLKDASLKDPMTGLYNRRFLEEYLTTLTASVARRQMTVGILMCDVDFFKQVNDSFGHEVGDQVLKGTAKILQDAVRAADLVIRYGGEEFLVLLVDAGEEKSLEVAERIRGNLESYIFQTASDPLRKTLSAGVALFPEDAETFWACVKYADIAMYEAKKSGRNRVLRFRQEMWKEGDQY